MGAQEPAFLFRHVKNADAASAPRQERCAKVLILEERVRGLMQANVCAGYLQGYTLSKTCAAGASAHWPCSNVHRQHTEVLCAVM